MANNNNTRSGFFQSFTNDPRYYTNEDMSRIFDGLISDGVYANYLDSFKVVPTATASMDVVVKPGRAWLNHTWTYQPADYTLAIQPSEQWPRIDYVVLEVNASTEVRANRILVLKGIASSVDAQPPALIKDDEKQIWQYPLAQINVGRNVATITAKDIVQLVGTKEGIPFIIGMVKDTITVDQYLDAFNASWNEWFNATKVSYKSWYDTESARLTAEIDKQEAYLNTFVTTQTKEMSEFRASETKNWTEWKKGVQAGIDDWLKTQQNYWLAEQQVYIDLMKDFFPQEQSKWNAELETNRNEWVKWRNDREDEWTTWYASMQGILQGDIDKLAGRVAKLEADFATVRKQSNDTVVIANNVQRGLATVQSSVNDLDTAVTTLTNTTDGHTTKLAELSGDMIKKATLGPDGKVLPAQLPPMDIPEGIVTEADYCTGNEQNPKIVDHCLFANKASSAKNADTAQTATSAGTAKIAEKANNATKADTATNADNATKFAGMDKQGLDKYIEDLINASLGDVRLRLRNINGE